MNKVIGKSHAGFLCVVCFCGFSSSEGLIDSSSAPFFSAAHIHVAILVHVHVL